MIVQKTEGKRQNVLGDNQVVKLSGKDTNGQFLLIEQEDEPGVCIPMHIHQNEDELFKVIEGELKITIGKTTKILKSGDIAFCPRGIPHTWEVIGNEKMKSLLLITPAGLETMFEELANLRDIPPNFNRVAEITKKYHIEFL